MTSEPVLPAPAAGPAAVPRAASALRDAVVDAARYADHWLGVQQRLQRVPGVQVAVAHEDELLLNRAYGYADVATGTPLTTNHLFRIASHSKTFTATVVLQLVEDGALRLDDRADVWLEHLHGTPLGAATLRDLLSHGAGISRDSLDGDFWQLAHPFPGADDLRQMTGPAAAVVPVAERFKYSNLGYGLLGLVIEAATGRPFATVVRNRITTPLGLADTEPEWSPTKDDAFATGHTGLATASTDDGARRLPIAAVDTRALAPATGFCSTAQDLVRFAAAHYLGDERLLSDASKRRMQHSEWPSGRDGEDYGLGLIITTIGGRRTVGHSGGFPGYITRTIVDPVDRFAVSVLTNAIDGPASSLAASVVRLVNLAADVPAQDDAMTADLDRFTGRFANLWGLLDVVRLGGALYALDPSAGDPTDHPVRLTPVDGSTLRIGGGTGYGSFGEHFRYTWSSDGQVSSLRADSGQSAYPAESYVAALAALPSTISGPLPR